MPLGCHRPRSSSPPPFILFVAEGLICMTHPIPNIAYACPCRSYVAPRPRWRDCLSFACSHWGGGGVIEERLWKRVHGRGREGLLTNRWAAACRWIYRWMWWFADICRGVWTIILTSSLDFQEGQRSMDLCNRWKPPPEYPGSLGHGDNLMQSCS